MTNTIASTAIASTTSARKARSFAGVSRTTGLRVPLALIMEESGFNARMDSVENAQHIDNMALAFSRGDEPETLEVVPVVLEDGSEGFKLVDGHCTFKAINRANEVYGASFESIEVKAKEMSTLEQRLRVLTSNNQKKLNMVERGKMFHDLVELEGQTQTQVAERLNISVALVSNCIQCFKMPEELKQLVADGILSDNEALTRYRTSIKSYSPEETASKAQSFASKVQAVSQTRVAKGESKRVSSKAVEGDQKGTEEAPQVRFSREVKASVAKAMTEINHALEGVEEGQGATLELTAEQVAILRKAGVSF
jgi:ParB-like chromosome segregation protein Spo0J